MKYPHPLFHFVRLLRLVAATAFSGRVSGIVAKGDEPPGNDMRGVRRWLAALHAGRALDRLRDCQVLAFDLPLPHEIGPLRLPGFWNAQRDRAKGSRG